jgi:hypothetical protein
MIVIRALENGMWVIDVTVRKSRTQFIRRGKVCRV